MADIVKAALTTDDSLDRRRLSVHSKLTAHRSRDLAYLSIKSGENIWMLA